MKLTQFVALLLMMMMMMTSVAVTQASIYERSKRDSSSSSGGHGHNWSPVDECALLGNYIATDLATLPGGSVKLLNFTLVAQAVPAFSALLTSAPTLFASLSPAIQAASNQIVIPPSFLHSTNKAGIAALAALSADFVALANDSCGLALSTDRVRNVEELFRFVLSTFVIYEQECDLLDVNIVEQAIATATTASSNRLEDRLRIGVGIPVFFRRRLFRVVRDIINLTPDAEVPAAMQAVLDEFLFFINDFCGIPPLSSTALGQLDDYFLVDLVALATQ